MGKQIIPLTQKEIGNWLALWAISNTVDVDEIKTPEDVPIARRFCSVMRKGRFYDVSDAEIWEALQAIPKQPKAHNGAWYFPTYEQARGYAEVSKLPTDRIIQYDLGWAIQLRIGGAYAGPND